MNSLVWFQLWVLTIVNLVLIGMSSMAAYVLAEYTCINYCQADFDYFRHESDGMVLCHYRNGTTVRIHESHGRVDDPCYWLTAVFIPVSAGALWVLLWVISAKAIIDRQRTDYVTIT